MIIALTMVMAYERSDLFREGSPFARIRSTLRNVSGRRLDHQHRLTEVGWKRQELLSDKRIERIYRRVAEILVPVDLVIWRIRDTKVASGLRNINLILFHGGMIAVVAVMGNLPAEVWFHEEVVRQLRDLR